MLSDTTTAMAYGRLRNFCHSQTILEGEALSLHMYHYISLVYKLQCLMYLLLIF